MQTINNKGLSVKDLVTVGIFSALFLVFALVGGIFFTPNPVLTFYMPVGSALLCGPVYLLMMAKVQKRWAVTILGAILCIVWFVTGMHWAMALSWASWLTSPQGQDSIKQKGQFHLLHSPVSGRHSFLPRVLCRPGRLGADHAGQRYRAVLHRHHALHGNDLDHGHHAGRNDPCRICQRLCRLQDAEKAV